MAETGSSGPILRITNVIVVPKITTGIDNRSRRRKYCQRLI
jgi:hypothetical protein